MQRSSYILFRMRDTACGMWMTCIRSHAPMMRLKTGPTSGGEIRRCGRSGDFPRLLRFLFLTSNVSMGIHFTLNHSKPERRYPLRDGGCLAAVIFVVTRVSEGRPTKPRHCPACVFTYRPFLFPPLQIREC